MLQILTAYSRWQKPLSVRELQIFQPYSLKIQVKNESVVNPAYMILTIYSKHINSKDDNKLNFLTLTGCKKNDRMSEAIRK